jgi:hypothetical protein
MSTTKLATYCLGERRRCDVAAVDEESERLAVVCDKAQQQRLGRRG